MRPRDYTEQETILGAVLTELNLRFEQQYEIGQYTADFFVPELRLIIEADGIYGHLRKRDRKRDKDILKLGEESIDRVVHIKTRTHKNIRDELCQEVEGLCQELAE